MPHEPLESSTSDEEVMLDSRYNFRSFELQIYYEKEVNNNMAPLLPLTNGQIIDRELTNPKQDYQNGAANANSLLERDQTKEDDKNPFSLPEGKIEKLCWMVMMPWKLSFHYTVPDCSKVLLSFQF